jgi:Tfp pilus assembly PilM family ATPase
LAIEGDEILHACIVGQPQAMTDGLRELAAAKITDPVLHFAPAATVNAVLPQCPVQGDDTCLVIDIGSRTTALTLLSEGRFLACRQLMTGGDAFTDALVAAGHDRQLAEQSKVQGIPLPRPIAAVAAAERSDGPFLDLGESESDDRPGTDQLTLDEPVVVDLSHPPHPPRPAAPREELDLDGDADGDDASDESLTMPVGDPETRSFAPPGGETKRLATVLGPELTRATEALQSQIASSLLWFKTQLKLPSVRPAWICLAGGGAGLLGLDGYLSRRLGVPVKRFDPFAGLALAKGVTVPAEPHAWTAAIGLAMADPAFAGPAAVQIDLRPSSHVLRDFHRRRFLWPFAAAAFVVLATLSAGIVLGRENAAVREEAAAYQDFVARNQKAMQSLKTLDSQKAALSEDLRAVASRIYANRDLLNTVRALKDGANKHQQLWVLRIESQAIGTDNRATGETRAGDTRATDTRTTAATSAKGPIGDTSIERGKVLVSGKVKFNDPRGQERTDSERNRFFTEWSKDLGAWLPAPGAPPLFKPDSRDVVLWEINRSRRAATLTIGNKRTAVDEGEFPFIISYEFAPTDLSQVTFDARAAKPESTEAAR